MSRLSRNLRKFRAEMRVLTAVYNETKEILRVADGELHTEYLRGALTRQAARVLLDFKKSKSQLGQDLFVLQELDYKHNGYFVEFGAADGVELSNTHLLENAYGWNGILAEPATIWHPALRQNRTSIVDHDCVWHTSGQSLDFIETQDPALSTMDRFRSCDMHSETRADGRSYKVETVSLMDLLVRHGAPRKIDYLSIDTEGSEYDILEAFDFSSYEFKVITCEHNHTPQRGRIHALLTSAGYVRKYERRSNFDDWYVKPD